MQNDKNQVVAMANDVFQRWQSLLAEMTQHQILAKLEPSHWSTKDVIAHLWGWQQRSIARLEAGRLGGEPVFPDWPAGLDPESEDDVHQVNDFIYESNRGRSWVRVYQEWQAGFQRLLELAEVIPQEDMETVGRFPWLQGYSLAYIVFASVDHHQEHLDNLQTWLRDKGEG